MGQLIHRAAILGKETRQESPRRTLGNDIPAMDTVGVTGLSPESPSELWHEFWDSRDFHLGIDVHASGKVDKLSTRQRQPHTMHK